MEKLTEQLQYLFLEEFPYTYQWSTGSTTDTNTISDLAAGVYTVTVKDALNKVITSTFTVNEPSVIVIPSTKEATVYYGYAKTLAQNFLQVTWSTLYVQMEQWCFD
jgi:hypothetical protein